MTATTTITPAAAQSAADLATQAAATARQAAQDAHSDAAAAADALELATQQIAQGKSSPKKFTEIKEANDYAQARAAALQAAADQADIDARAARLDAIGAVLADKQTTTLDRAMELIDTIEAAARELLEIQQTRDRTVADLYRAALADGVAVQNRPGSTRDEDRGLTLVDHTRMGFPHQGITYRGRQTRTQTTSAGQCVALALRRATNGLPHLLGPGVKIGWDVGRGDDERERVARALG